MSHLIIETGITFPAQGSITAPDDGDPSTAASVNAALVALAERTYALRINASIGLLTGADYFRANLDGTCTLSPFEVWLEGDRYGWPGDGSPLGTVAAPTTGVTFDGVPGSGLGWWYLYAEAGTLGVASLRWSQIAPTGAWLEGSENETRYIACAFNHIAGALYPMTRVGRDHRFEVFDPLTLTGGGGVIPAAWTSYPLVRTPAVGVSPGIPANSRIATLSLVGNMVGADVSDTCRVLVRSQAFTGETAERDVIRAEQSVSDVVLAEFTTPTDAAGAIQMRSEGFESNINGGWPLTCYVTGFVA